jgi:hypothetical protein
MDEEDGSGVNDHLPVIHVAGNVVKKPGTGPRILNVYVLLFFFGRVG